MFSPHIPQPNISAIRNSPRRPAYATTNSMNATGVASRNIMNFEDIKEENEELPADYATLGPGSGRYDAYNVSPVNGSNSRGMMNSTAVTSAAAATAGGAHNNLYYAQNLAYQGPWGPIMGNMDAITFDSQDIDIGALGLQQPDLMGGWLEYMPSDVLGGLFDEHQESG
jgi:hypothetical protein